MSSSSKRFLLRHPTVVDTGCSCRSSKLSSFFTLSSSQKHKSLKTPFFSPSSATTTTSQSDFSHDAPTTHRSSSFDDSQSSSPSPTNFPADYLREKKRGLKKKKKGVMEQSVAVVKESWNPYLDFRASMMVMIVENEIYAWDNLCDLLNQFLSLNSPDQHRHILRAFAEIWNEVFSPSAAAAAGGSGPAA
ncbi:hypothetical protein M5K25_021489 [Dendrobium thyrsiflorum]|uniref:Transcription repressor n=1 Tax=Dendrobium thyrsiflorum TaxID=117978 RepID=A0ABD0UCK9_DENTH